MNQLRIRNKDVLLSHGNRTLRQVAIDIVENALNAVNSYSLARELIKLSDESLTVGSMVYDLSKVRDIFIISAGKASLGMAKALDEILGDIIKKGILLVKKGGYQKLRNTEVIEAGHPIPDEASFEGAKKILTIAKNVAKDDLVFYCDSGGSSALMSHPAEGSGIHFEDEQEMTRLLLNCGAPIYEINAVRRHITAMKGGRMQHLILSRGAEVINFMILDNPLYVYHSPNPLIPLQGGWEDETTFGDAIRVLNHYNLWDQTPKSIRIHLEKGLSGAIPETPKDFRGMKVHTFHLGNISTACEAAKKRAEDLGFNAMILTTVLEGESKDVGIVLSGIAKEAAILHRPIEPPCVFIFGGETTVTLEEDFGEGGPSQELALAFAIKIDGYQNIVGLALDTDGTDGPTDLAGAIVDGFTLEEARKVGLDAWKHLKNHNSSGVMKKLGDAILSGPTDTNVCDVNILVIGTEVA